MSLAGGGSLAIDQEGQIVGQLGKTEEAVLVYDTVKGTAIAQPIVLSS